MKRILLITLGLTLSAPAPAACDKPGAVDGFQWGLGIQSLFPGNHPDFKLLSPGYLLTGGHRWNNTSLYGTVQYASSTAFALYSFEGSVRQILETPFLNFFGQAGAYYLSYRLETSVRRSSAGGLLAVGLLIQFSPSIEFTAHFKGYIETESMTAAGGTFLFNL